MTDHQKYRSVLKAVRAGLATNVGQPPGFHFDPSDVRFDLPGGISVVICLERTSLQCWNGIDGRAIGGRRAANKVLAALVDQGYEDTFASCRPWDELADAIDPAGQVDDR